MGEVGDLVSEAVFADRVHVRAPGKLNLFFEVGGVQEDGYHDVASAYQAVSLYENVWASPGDDFTVTISGTVDITGVPADDRNLAVRAARMVAQRIGYRGGVHLDIVKNVPVAGGMGGGSADAAAALVACDALWGAELGSAELHKLAARLGADVPFALMGGTAIGTGRDDVRNIAAAESEQAATASRPSDSGAYPRAGPSPVPRVLRGGAAPSVAPRLTGFLPVTGSRSP